MPDSQAFDIERLKGFAAGTASGLTKVAVGHPFDTIKLRMQCTLPGIYKGPLDCLIQTIRHEGPFAVYKGVTPQMLGFAASDSALMGSLHNYRLFLARRKGQGEENVAKLNLFEHCLAGAGAGLTVCTIMTPVELVKAKLQMQSHHTAKLYSGPVDCVKQIIQNRGIFGLYHGFLATLAFRSWFGPYFVTYVVSMDHFRKQGLEVSKANFFAGGIASNVFWLGTFPFDAIKNRLMSDSITNPRYNGWVHTFKTIWAEGGLRAFYRGFVPCLLRAFPTNASALFVWEAVMRSFGAKEFR